MNCFEKYYMPTLCTGLASSGIGAGFEDLI